MNAIASLAVGRDYLTSNDCIILTLIDELLKDNDEDNSVIKDAIVHDHLLATLQKLSLRSAVRDKLIESGRLFKTIMISNFALVSIFH